MIYADIHLPELYESDMKPVGPLHPQKAGYTLTETPLSTANLVLDKETVTQGQMVRMYDTYGSIGVFRVSKSENTFDKTHNQQKVLLEHALATLADTLVVGYREFGGDGVTTQQVLMQLIALQTAQYWVLGTCEFTDEYMYSSENELLLNVILSIASPLTSAYRWTFDMSIFPFVLNLVHAPTEPTIELRTSRNIKAVKYILDRSEMRTRLYPLGYGEGVNQLGIADVNGGVPYIELNTGIYGVVEDVFVDTTLTDAQTLKDTALAFIESAAQPKATTEVTALDVFLRTGEPLDAIKLGEVARVPLEEYGVEMNETVVSITKRDIYGKPYDVKVTMTNQLRDAVRDTATLLRKARVGDLYSQGSTAFVPMHYADNADASNALECDFYLDASEIYINAVLCKFKLEAFRSYSSVSASGGGQTKTSSSGGNSSTYFSQETSIYGGDSGNASPGTGGPSSNITSAADGSEGMHIHSLNSHSHTVYSHHHYMTSHSHFLTFTITVPSHTHNVTIDDHTHGIVHGIYRGSTASSVSIAVDGNAVDPGDIVDNQFDAVPYLDKDEDGKITRNTWHTISFTPNALSRIVADIQKKTFIRAITGGNY